MKLFLIMTLLFSSVAFSKTKLKTRKWNKKSKMTKTNTTSKKFDLRVPIKNWLSENKDNFRIGIGQGSLATNTRARNANFDDSINESRSTKLQLQVGWEKIRTQEINYSVYFTYQDIADGLEDFNGNTEDIRSLRWSANATYGINEQVYTYGGLNLNKYYGSGEIESNIDRGIGYQAGLGFKFHERANVELEYLTLINEGKIDTANLDIEAKGILIKLNTPISLNI